MPFLNCEKDIRRMKAVLSGEPNLVYFGYGLINSGNTASLMKMFEEGIPISEGLFEILFRSLKRVEDILGIWRGYLRR
jgi:AAA+ ATPase superfamily predicted ATPase